MVEEGEGLMFVVVDRNVSFSGFLSDVLVGGNIARDIGYEVIGDFPLVVLNVEGKYVVMGFGDFNGELRVGKWFFSGWDEVLEWIAVHVPITFVYVRRVRVEVSGDFPIVKMVLGEWCNVLNDCYLRTVIKELINNGCSGLRYWKCDVKRIGEVMVVRVIKYADGYVNNFLAVIMAISVNGRK